MGANVYKPLEKAIGYRFRRKAKLALALMHRSFRHEAPSVDEDNQRLEFLGDAALGLAAAEHLFRTRPDAQEGDLTQYRSLVTSTTALAERSAHAGVGAYLQLGKGDRAAGGATRESTLADTLEAIIGAAYLDGGMKAVHRIFSALFSTGLGDGKHVLQRANPKGYLQELCQAQWSRSPQYLVLEESGPPHARSFRVEVRLEDCVLGRGTGNGRRAAETAAAQQALRDWKRSSSPAPGRAEGPIPFP